eukprot:Lithocolla_globosa_v1_NODE_774_length_3296_cov_7.908979.p2 type:complete len:124 gc:universal NODE_774_length_3296_cov_7.908979:2107-1736(-)
MLPGFDEVWRIESGASCCGSEHFIFLFQNMGNPEVSHAYFVIFCQKNVVGFDVTMNDALKVQIFDGDEDVTEVETALFFGQGLHALHRNVEDRALCAQLKHHVEIDVLFATEKLHQTHKVRVI